MNPAFKVRNVLFALLGVAALVFKPAYTGPLQEIVLSYGGNFSVSFALYFAAINATVSSARPRTLAALLVLLAVQSFEALDGFGIMANVYDSLDFLANFAGVGFALVADVASKSLMTSGGHETTGRSS